MCFTLDGRLFIQESGTDQKSMIDTAATSTRSTVRILGEGSKESQEVSPADRRRPCFIPPHLSLQALALSI